MPNTLVSTAWVADQLDASAPAPAAQAAPVSDAHAAPQAPTAPKARTAIIETSSTRLDGYAAAHIPGALVIDWLRDLVDRDDESSGLVIDAARFAALASSLGIQPNDTLIFYGDMGGRHAARALWTFEYYRHPGDLHLMDGGREAWQREGRPMTADVPDIVPTVYPLPPAPDDTLRATRDDITAALDSDTFVPLDTRTRDEYDAKDIRAARGGRIPGATHVFWKDNVAEDASFKSKAELKQIYAAIPREATVAAYCQLGMRAAHSWFVLRHVLGYPNARNYDGSWQEWGNEADTPIENETTS